MKWHGRGEIVYIPFPDHLKGRYQSFTEADISALRKAGYEAPFSDVATGIKNIWIGWRKNRGKSLRGKLNNCYE